ncbi:hypothetical protein ACFVR1_17430 [Psychrobacillus sp. NPDC058041]|uniref:hypothetical protein n=1 Tax=Psychrobacillus sp. NPDC058041 TaxID=3346310 RepID=UPI0036D86285
MLTSESISKIEQMDNHLNSLGKKITASDICKAVDLFFGIPLEGVPIINKSFVNLTPKTAMEMYMDQYEHEMGSMEIRKMLNHIFGINLEGIDSLSKLRISLYSKGQWIVQNEKDLFVIHTGTNDVDVKVVPSEYFIKQTGSSVLPKDLQDSLSSLGFNYDDKLEGSYYINPNNESVTNEFKKQTIGSIVGVIQKLYSHL